MEIDKAWAENFFVTKATLMHERAHTFNQNYLSRGRRIFTSVPVYNDLEEYNLYGMTDCLEVEETDLGSKLDLDSLKGKDIRIVEYKPTKPKVGDYYEEDLMQIFAQKICVDYVFSCNCSAEIYYGDVKRRYRLPLKENYSAYNEKLKIILKEIRENLKFGRIPPIRTGQKCGGCSMRDLCMPKLKKGFNLKTQIRVLNKDSQEQL